MQLTSERPDGLVPKVTVKVLFAVTTALSTGSLQDMLPTEVPVPTMFRVPGLAPGPMREVCHFLCSS